MWNNMKACVLESKCSTGRLKRNNVHISGQNCKKEINLRKTVIIEHIYTTKQGHKIPKTWGHMYFVTSVRL